MGRPRVTPPLRVVDLGRRGYADALDLQRALCRRRIDGALEDDVLILVEHDPVVTLGRGTRPGSLPVPVDQLVREGVEVFEVERGGDVTCHEPGQLVGYPVLDLQHHRPDLHWYLRQLEGTLIDALGTLGVPAGPSPGRTGVWAGSRKVASIGVHVKRWITLHGFALNVTNDLRGFDRIVPCGLPGVEMTSVAREVARAGMDGSALWPRTRTAVIEAMGARFDRAPVAAEADEIAALTGAGTAH